MQHANDTRTARLEQIAGEALAIFEGYPAAADSLAVTRCKVDACCAFPTRQIPEPWKLRPTFEKEHLEAKANCNRWEQRYRGLVELVEAELPELYGRLQFVRRGLRLLPIGDLHFGALLQELATIRDEARQRAPGISTNARTKQSEGAARRATDSPTLDASTAPEATGGKAEQHKSDKPPTKTERTRKQRLDFIKPRQARGETWQAIYDKYHSKYPGDLTASGDALRLTWERHLERQENTDSSE